MSIRELDTFEAGCIRCGGTGWVCENHPNKPWSDGPEYYRPWYAFWVKRGCDCGAGCPCPDCNNLSDWGREKPQQTLGVQPTSEYTRTGVKRKGKDGVSVPDPASEAAYFASIWGLSNPKMKALETAFQKFFDAGREPESAVEAVRSMIKPDAILLASEIQLPAFPRKAVFNALTYLTRTGELARIGYGKYQSPPADPLPTSEQIARDLRDGTFQGKSP